MSLAKTLSTNACLEFDDLVVGSKFFLVRPRGWDGDDVLASRYFIPDVVSQHVVDLPLFRLDPLILVVAVHSLKVVSWFNSMSAERNRRTTGIAKDIA
jgi:hypothetical protein